MKEYAIVVVLLLGVIRSIQLARADYDSSHSELAPVMQSCRLAPESASYWLRASNLREIDEPEDPAVDAGIARALQLNPRFAEALMERALRNETHGRVTEAEHDYLTAARVDHMYKPVWALANFYIRQNHPQQFWVYARKCLEVVEPRRLEPASYNPAPVFDLAWRVSQDAAEIRRKLIPPRHFILADYLEYLRQHDRMDAGADLAMDLANYADPADSFNLLNFCEQLINGPKGDRAVKVWNAMVDHGTVRSERLEPEHGRSLSNGDLKRAFGRVGFDWRMPAADGVLQNHFTDSGEVRFEFSGDQPEDVLLLYQSIPVVPGRSYCLSFRYRTCDMDHAEGLAWQVWDYAAQRAIPAASQFAAHPEWTHGEARFRVPGNVSMVRLGLAYRRTSGTTRIRGAAALANFGLRMEGS